MLEKNDSRCEQMRQKTGHGEKLSRKQEAACAALLTSPTIGDAAIACGVSSATLFRWLQVPTFQARYRWCRRQIVESAIADVQAAAGDAVTTLRRNLACNNPAAENRAAQIILDLSLKGVELIDLVERVEKLEVLLKPTQQSKWA